MNKEEKEAIENAEKFLNFDKDNLFNHRDIKIILNLIDKLQKEIQKLKEIKQTCYEDIDNIRNEYDKEIEEYKKQIDLEFVEENYIEKSKVISKNKIRTKIKELEEKQMANTINYSEYHYKTEILNELLGE